MKLPTKREDIVSARGSGAGGEHSVGTISILPLGLRIRKPSWKDQGNRTPCGPLAPASAPACCPGYAGSESFVLIGEEKGRSGLKIFLTCLRFPRISGDAGKMHVHFLFILDKVPSSSSFLFCFFFLLCCASSVVFLLGCYVLTILPATITFK